MGYNQLYFSSFQGANQNPIDPTNWTEIYAPRPLQVYNGQCCALTGTVLGQEYLNTNLTADQWCQYTVSAQTLAGNESEIITGLRYVYGSNIGYTFNVSAISSGEMYWYVSNPNNSTIGQVFPAQR
jgi:hypothetical protein